MMNEIKEQMETTEGDETFSWESLIQSAKELVELGVLRD